MRKPDLGASTMSNIVYAAIGYIILPHIPVLGVCILLLALGSFLGHAVGIWWADWIGMWLVFACIMLLPKMIGHDYWVQAIYVIFATIILRLLELLLREYKERVLGFRYHYLLLGWVYFVGALGSLVYLEWHSSLAYFSIFIVALVVREKVHWLWHWMTAFGLAYYAIRLKDAIIL
jgi:hypothetical protein